MADAEDRAWVLQHRGQLETIGLPEKLWGLLAEKRRRGIYDAGSQVNFCLGAEELHPRERWAVEAIEDIEAHSNIWLSDHIWLFCGAMAAREEIVGFAELRRRLHLLLCGVDPGDGNAEGQDPDELLLAVSSLAHPIKFAAPGGVKSRVMHYVMDEFGSRITLVPQLEKTSANCRCAAFFDVATGSTLSLIWPVATICAGSRLTRVAEVSLELMENGEKYWSRRFDAEETFIWYGPWESTGPHVLRAYDETLTHDGEEKGAGGLCVVVGNGNCPLPVEFARARPNARVLATDFCANVVNLMRDRFATATESGRIRWETGDARNWASFGLGLGESAEFVVDKGLLDALLIKPIAKRENPTDMWLSGEPESVMCEALKYLREVARVLIPGRGRLCCFTYGKEESRNALFDAAGLRVLRWESVEATEGMLRGEHGDAVDPSAIQVVVATPATVDN